MGASVTLATSLSSEHSEAALVREVEVQLRPLSDWLFQEGLPSPTPAQTQRLAPYLQRLTQDGSQQQTTDLGDGYHVIHGRTM